RHQFIRMQCPRTKQHPKSKCACCAPSPSAEVSAKNPDCEHPTASKDRAMPARRFPPPCPSIHSPSTRRRCSSRIPSAMSLHGLLAGGNRIAAAHRGALQCVNRLLSSFPLIVVSGLLGHVVIVVLFLGQCHFKDGFGFPDQSQSSLNLLATCVIHAGP